MTNLSYKLKYLSLTANFIAVNKIYIRKYTIIDYV